MKKLTDEELALIIADTKSRIELADVPTQFYPSYIYRLATELQALRLAQRWQPIETAPKDGTPFIGKTLSGRGVLACFWNGNFCIVERDVKTALVFTHWREIIPSAPERSQP